MLLFLEEIYSICLLLESSRAKRHSMGTFRCFSHLKNIKNLIHILCFFHFNWCFIRYYLWFTVFSRQEQPRRIISNSFSYHISRSCIYKHPIKVRGQEDEYV